MWASMPARQTKQGSQALLAALRKMTGRYAQAAFEQSVAGLARSATGFSLSLLPILINYQMCRTHAADMQTAPCAQLTLERRSF